MNQILIISDVEVDKFDIGQFTSQKDNILDSYFFNFSLKKNFDSDILFVIEDIYKKKIYHKTKKTILLLSETLYEEEYWLKKSRKKFLEQFDIVIGPYKTFGNNLSDLPFLTWMINGNHQSYMRNFYNRDLNYFLNLKKIEKCKNLSVICSNKNFTPQHRDRLNFVYKLKEYFQENLDWFGSGVNEIETKWEGIAPYKYHIAIENKKMDYVISEKLFDSFLGLSLPFYYGGDLASKYFPANSFVNIDIKDIKKSIDIIENSINKNLYEMHYSKVIDAKNIVCNELNLFNRLVKISNNILTTEELNKKNIKIRNKNYFEEKFKKSENIKKNFFCIINKLSLLFKK